MTKMWVQVHNPVGFSVQIDSEQNQVWKRVPGWTGFNISVRKDVAVMESKISYLDTLDYPAIDLKTAFEVLCEIKKVSCSWNLFFVCLTRHFMQKQLKHFRRTKKCSVIQWLCLVFFIYSWCFLAFLALVMVMQDLGKFKFRVKLLQKCLWIKC